MRFLRVLLFALCILITAVSHAQLGRVKVDTRTGVPGPKVEKFAGREAWIRVRIQKDTKALKIGGRGQVRVGPDESMKGRVPEQTWDLPIEVTRVNKEFYIKSKRRGKVKWALPALMMQVGNERVLKLGDREYPHRLVLDGKNVSAFDVINHVPLEEYLPGVLARELYPDWDVKAFEAQAVAARSYALWEMTLKTGRKFDLESSTASQAYIGKTKASKPLTAVKNTRGMVLSWEGRIVPAFYSASHGGVTNDASVALLGKTPLIKPLMGKNVGDWGKVGAKVYSWGPQKRNRQMLSKRIAAYAKRRGHQASQLTEIRRVVVTKKSKQGRPIEFGIVDRNGKMYLLPCEWFRNACNYSDGRSIPKLARKDIVKSSFLTVTIKGNEVIFNGRGYGHGVGMSQWGAQGMALKGYTFQQILSNYYAGAAIAKLY
ncbi:Amidase enhancer precursor [Poriferisphaera corsica]|uniref:Amidase enhancer n=1 Tax=Poriferisphaera corsica TaxID=2528020 RepID=A0A517YQY0_9BACT|nr:SpoIID/LytB domain-containing protein [Poriferisphaera corsica]QDU32601.1 Amidase enhancer precursor [Poriferisphaera corsica]